MPPPPATPEEELNTPLPFCLQHQPCTSDVFDGTDLYGVVC